MKLKKLVGGLLLFQIFGLLIFPKTFGQTNQSDAATDTVKEISFLFLGDIMQHDLQIQSAFNPETNAYDFSSQFKYLKPLFDSTDVIVGNLEVTLGGPPYKGYPRFSSPDALADAIKNAGILYLATANNHMYDKGKAGFERTMRLLDSLNIKRTGTFIDQQDKEKNHPMVVFKNDFKIAVFNYTYGLNGNISLKPNLINSLQKDSIIQDLELAKEKDYDAIIVFFHWGNEYERQPNQEQIILANACFESGADIVIGSHPHVVQKMEHKPYITSTNQQKDVLIAYSLGNFVSNYGARRYSDGGVVIRFKLRKDDFNAISIIEPAYIPIWVYREPKDKGLFNYYVLPVSDFENKTGLDESDYNQMKVFMEDTRNLLKTGNINVPELKK
jgi:poly-gamma-glutamate synthesis protein (capsule biosynthesis protein)